jgi:hypothetical protein
MHRISSLLPAICITAFLLLPPSAGGSHLPYERLELPDCVLLLDWRGQFSAQQKTKLKAWLQSVGSTVSLLHGTLPRPEIRIALQPYPAKSAVPFARILRNDPQGVLFYINPDRPLEDYISDWTAYHELSHLFLPYPGNADIWFSEGLASYYQNILQARAGLLSNESARQKLRAGFQRGQNDSAHSTLTLGELSPVMRDKRAYMRVYWSGALYFLQADLMLRELPAGSKTAATLDDVLRKFGSCCLNSPQQWNGLAIAAEFDRLSGTDIFTRLYADYEQSTTIPEYQQLLESSAIDLILAP